MIAQFGKGVTDPGLVPLLERFSTPLEEFAYPIDLQESEERITYRFREMGVELSFRCHERDEVQLTTIYLLSEGYLGYHQYKREFLFGIGFDASRAEVQEKLGAPTYTSTRILLHDRYDFDQVHIHYSYDEISGRINIMTLMMPGTCPLD